MIPLAQTKKLMSESQEDYLKQIYLLTEETLLAGTQALADKLGVSPASVTVMVQKLAELDLVHYEQYKGVKLSENGTRAALEILRHHRLLESFLQKALGYGWDEVHDEAEKLEHYISERFESRMADWLGHPSHDPHGDPIPDAALVLPEAGQTLRLVEQAQGFQGFIVRVATQDTDELNLFRQLGLIPGIPVELTEANSDAVRVRCNKGAFLLPLALGAKLQVVASPGQGEKA
jgi:DtxR family Mn-dependent transcriptional regulator